MSRRMALRTSGRSRVNTTPHANYSCESHQGCAERLDRANDSGVTLPAWPMGTRASARWLRGGHDFP
jgi:hypothetical protein